MIACLSLVQHSHVRAARNGPQSITACGLAIDEAHVTPALFVADAADPTCPQCRFVPPSVEPVASQSAGGIDGFARWFIETVVGSNEGGELDRLFVPEIARWFTRDRIRRLHALFPGLDMVVDEVLAQEGKALVRYTMTGHDQSGLIGSAGDRLNLRQAVILELAGGLIARIDPLIDDVALWTLPSPGEQTV